MELIKELWNNSNRTHWGDGLRWLGWNIVGGFFPIWATLIGLRLTKQPLGVRAVSSKGEFALYAAALLAGTLYIVFKEFRLKHLRHFGDFKKITFPSLGWLCLLLVGLLVLCAFVFAFVCLMDVLSNTVKPEIIGLLDRDYLCWISQVALYITIPLALVVVVADNLRSDFDPHAMAAQEYTDLNKNFEEL
jgi:hypothetical protein